MSDPEILSQLFDLLAELTAESEGYLDRQDDPQLWYNRGYANGMAAALRALGLGDRVDALIEPDPYEVARDQDHLPWGKAYAHGRDLGATQTYEVLGADRHPDLQPPTSTPHA
ncbi:hypothetical protein F2Q65_11270 [Thiohalocapsa marina]|uniref:Uncharacterized protein n=1 Tax=Thiohalocapsa marina TaxID=424902 RepID=A0A5M8FID5_9GAMM|nr:hypothetical protein [Thiohalocapsa marina]KAA6184678.1 hypothetical protein F2Q65_11270 [Thiohalocapsa marina]